MEKSGGHKRSGSDRDGNSSGNTSACDAAAPAVGMGIQKEQRCETIEEKPLLLPSHSNRSDEDPKFLR